MSTILDELGLTTDRDVPAEPEASVVTATVVGATADLASFEVRRHDGTVVEAICPATEFYPDRQWHVGDRYAMLLLSGGNRPVVSAVRSDLLVAFYTGVAPEVRSGAVRIMGVVRLPGVRAKVAVAATEEGLDPVAACVGRKANRVKAVGQALAGERIDVVAWHDDQAQFLTNALAPAKIDRVKISGRDAEVYAPRHQMAAAIGGGGLNSSLAGRLTGLKVSVVPS